MSAICKDISRLDPEFATFVYQLKEELQNLHASGESLLVDVFETKRSVARQKEIYAAGHTRTMKSRHIEGTAVDFVVRDEKGNWTWDMNNLEVSKAYRTYGKVAKDLADLMGIKISWGGDWRSFKDYPHIQLER